MQVVGLDCEWRSLFIKGQPPNKVALVQLCSCIRDGHDCPPATDGSDAVCLLLHIHHSGITPSLQVGPTPPAPCLPYPALAITGRLLALSLSPQRGPLTPAAPVPLARRCSPQRP